MSRAALTITGDLARRRALAWVRNAPEGSFLMILRERRSDAQNRRLWAILTDISRQLPWHGYWLTPEEWKVMLIAALWTETRLLPAVSGPGMVALYRSSSKFSKDEMTQLIELAQAFAAENGVTLHDPTADLSESA